MEQQLILQINLTLIKADSRIDRLSNNIDNLTFKISQGTILF